MTKDQLRAECSRLFACNTIADSNDMLDIYINFLFQTIQNHQKEVTPLQLNRDAKIILQMMMTKALYLKKAIEGISHTSKDGSFLNTIIDPTIIASMIRNIYETTGLFNLIFRYSKNEDQKEILYLLWTSSGLKYRQKFKSIITKEENKEKQLHEEAEIEKIKELIQENNLFKTLDVGNQKKIMDRLKDKEYLIKFEDKKVDFLHWHQLTKTMGIKEGMLDIAYTYFSLYSHPSQVAVFQFEEMFNPSDEAYSRMTNTNLKISFFMFSIFIADYIKLFPNVIKTFEKLSLRDQIAINFHNTLARSQEFSINDSARACE